MSRKTLDVEGALLAQHRKPLWFLIKDHSTILIFRAIVTKILDVCKKMQKIRAVSLTLMFL